MQHITTIIYPTATTTTKNNNMNTTRTAHARIHMHSDDHRYNNDDRAPLTSLTTRDVQRFYTYLPLLLDVFRDPSSTLVVGLQKGDMVITNNHR